MSEEHLLNIEWVDRNSVKPYYRNSRRNDETVKVVAESIKKYGWQQPIVVDENMTIVAGHSRWQAAELLGVASVPITRFIGSTRSAREYRILDNRSQEYSDWDYDLLKSEMLDLTDLPTGFTDQEIDKLFGVDSSKNARALPSVFELVFYCDSETQQREIYEYVNKELKRTCRTLSI